VNSIIEKDQRNNAREGDQQQQPSQNSRRIPFCDISSQYQVCVEVIRMIQLRGDRNGSLSVQDIDCLTACDQLLARISSQM